jgi:hypothetical protein
MYTIHYLQGAWHGGGRCACRRFFLLPFLPLVALALQCAQVFFLTRLGGEYAFCSSTLLAASRQEAGVEGQV